MLKLPTLVGQEFAYAFGRSGVLQQLLLHRTDVDRLLGASGKKDADKILTELKLTSMVDQGISASDQMLQAVADWIKNEVESMSPASRQDVFSVIWLDSDAAYTSYAIKKHLGLTSAISQPPHGFANAIDHAAIDAAIAGDTTVDLPKTLRLYLQNIASRTDLPPQTIDDMTTAVFAQLKLERAKRSGSRLIKQYVAHQIDLLNIKNALREYDKSVIAGSFLPGGSIAAKDLTGSRKDIVDAVRRSDLYTIADDLATAADDPIAFEHVAAQRIAHDIGEMWSVPMSIEPLFAFAAIGYAHLRLLRSILIGKNNGMSPQEIKQILPPFIPATHYAS